MVRGGKRLNKASLQKLKKWVFMDLNHYLSIGQFLQLRRVRNLSAGAYKSSRFPTKGKADGCWLRMAHMAHNQNTMDILTLAKS